jgi:RNA recognition motif-containing protein
MDEIIMKLRISNLPSSTSDDDLASLFRPFGYVTSAQVLTTTHAGRSHGYGFVEMLRESGELAMAQLDGRQLDCRVLRVNRAMA